MDHAIAPNPVSGLEKPLDMIQKVAEAGADAVIVSLGIAERFCKEIPRNIGLIITIQPDPRFIPIVTKIGADAVKNTFFGSLEDKELNLLYLLAVTCQEWGMPFLSEIVPMDVKNRKFIYDVEKLKVAARMAAEFGADYVKTSFTGNEETFKKVVENCPIPIVTLGGAKMDNDQAILETVKGTIGAGGAGIAFGRNIFQHRDPAAITRAIAKIIHEDADVQEAMK
jgi:DhnA family fructose-bisphosphate aldolase class Ia